MNTVAHGITSVFFPDITGSFKNYVSAITQVT
jgi:hypothetical protein